jgi:hypothetical protein
MAPGFPFLEGYPSIASFYKISLSRVSFPKGFLAGEGFLIFAACSRSICLQVFLLYRGTAGRDSLNGEFFTLGFL